MGNGIVVTDGGACKDDQGKLRLDLVPPEATEALGRVLTFGAAKYGDRNWERGIDQGRVHAAALRHLLAWQKGEQADPESGISHLAHALCNLAFLVTFEARVDTPAISPERAIPGVLAPEPHAGPQESARGQFCAKEEVNE